MGGVSVSSAGSVNRWRRSETDGVVAYELEDCPARLRILRVGGRWFASCLSLGIDCVPLEATVWGGARMEAFLLAFQAVKDLHAGLLKHYSGKAEVG